MNVGNSGFNSERALGVLDIMVGSASHPNSYILRSGYQDTNLNDYDISLFAVSNAWAAVTDIRCYFSSGNINTGVFHLYGIADGA